MKSSLQLAKRCIKPNAGQSKNPRDDTHMYRGRGQGEKVGSQGFPVAAPAACCIS